MDTLKDIEDRLVARGLLRFDGRVSTLSILQTQVAVALYVAARDRVAGTLAGAVGR